MKTTVFFAVMMTFCSVIYAQTEYFYTSTGDKEYLSVNKDCIVLSVTEEKDANSLSRNPLFKELSKLKDELYIATVSTDIEKSNLEKTVDWTYMFNYSDGTIQAPTHQLFIKPLKGELLETIFSKTEIKKNLISFRPVVEKSDVYIVTLDCKLGEMIAASRKIYETGLVEFAEPAFIRQFRQQASYYPDQWGFHNTGQNNGSAGIDINIEAAWAITKGSADIKVAVIDEGVDLTHPDLQANILPGYDATNENLGGGCVDLDAHGTCCAGIIAALDNDTGVVGVAPNVKIIPIRVAYKQANASIPWTTDEWEIAGIHHAWYNAGANILSNSWGGGSSSAAVTNEINDAFTLGNCVIVFSAGNYNSEVLFPGNLPNVIAVGAMSPCGERKRSSHLLSNVAAYVSPDPQGVSCDGVEYWGSDYGQELDVVAPGVFIPTTDVHTDVGYNYGKFELDYDDYDYTHWFSGTSAACPHVAGIAALMLSVNPSLTNQEVKNMIEKTTRKVGGYNYQITLGRPNGTWNEEMGYGLVDAYRAVRLAMGYLDIINDTIPAFDNVTYEHCGEILIQNVVVDEYAYFSAISGQKITILPPFYTSSNSFVELFIYPCSDSPSYSSAAGMQYHSNEEIEVSTPLAPSPLAPSAGVYYADQTVFNPEGRQLSIYNIYGVKAISGAERRISVRRLPAGVYIVRNEIGETIKFTKQF